MEPNIEITENTIIADILQAYPYCIEVFDKHEMPCRTCMGVTTDTVAESAVMHDVDLGQLLDELHECSRRSGGNSTGSV